MPAFIWHIDGAAVIFDWKFADLWEASGCCLFRQVFIDCRWRLLVCLWRAVSVVCWKGVLSKTQTFRHTVACRSLVKEYEESSVLLVNYSKKDKILQLLTYSWSCINYYFQKYLWVGIGGIVQGQSTWQAHGRFWVWVQLCNKSTQLNMNLDLTWDIKKDLCSFRSKIDDLSCSFHEGNFVKNVSFSTIVAGTAFFVVVVVVQKLL